MFNKNKAIFEIKEETYGTMVALQKNIAGIIGEFIGDNSYNIINNMVDVITKDIAIKCKYLQQEIEMILERNIHD